MPRLEQIVAHIANQSGAQDQGQDVQKINAYLNTLTARYQDLSAREDDEDFSPNEEAELKLVEYLQNKTQEFLEKERELKEALDAQPRNQEAIRSAMRGAMQASNELDNMYTQLKDVYPKSPAVTGSAEFDALWQTETFEDAAETLTDIGNYRRSRVAQDIEEGAPEDLFRGRQREYRRGERHQYFSALNDPSDYIDENAEPEECSIISMEDLQGKKRTAYGALDVPTSVTLLSSQLQVAGRLMKTKVSRDPDLSDEDNEIYQKVGDKLNEYSAALNNLVHVDPKEEPERYAQNLKKVSTLPAFLGQRNLQNHQTNYKLIANVLDEPISNSSSRLLDNALDGTSNFLQMDLNVRHLNPDFDPIRTPGKEPEAGSADDPILSTKDGDYFFSENPKEDLAKGLAETTFRVQNPNANPSEAQLKKRAAQIKEMPMFVQLSKNPARMEKILRSKDFTRTMQSFVSPFSTCTTARKKETLEKLKMLKEAGTFDSKQNRSSKWCNLMDSLDAIDTSDPETYDRQLQSIFDKTEIYQKGKKALGRDEGVNRRFGQSVNILGVLAQAGDAPKDRCNVLVDRTNYVRTRWGRTQPTISLAASTLPMVDKINKDYNEIKVAEKDLYKRHQLKNNQLFPDYGLLQALPDETIKKQPERNLNI